MSVFYKQIMSEVEFRKIFENIQKSTSSHLKCVKILSKIYESVAFEDFFSEFFKCVCVLLQQKIGDKTHHVQKCFKFCASFCSHLIDQDAKKNDKADSDASHPFLMRLLQELLKYHNVDYVQVRFHTCQFIATLLININEEVTLNNDLCDDIQNAMLERMTELKPFTRVQAAAALGRLQDISNNDCPVIKAFAAALGDSSSMVRKEVLFRIAPCPLTFGKIVERTRDVDHIVRMGAFNKLALIGPKVYRIIDRQIIALTGINEESKVAKKSFVKVLITWLSVYDDDYIKLLNALKLDSDEEDFKKTTFIYEKILDIFCAIKPVKEMISALHLNDNNLVTSDKLSIETVIYWHHLLNYLEAKENMEEYYEMITPEPLPLVECIAGYTKEKTSSKLEDWEYLEFQHILCKLYQIANKIDLADEASRNALHKLIRKTMIEMKLDNLVLSEMINVLKNIFPDLEHLSNEIFSVIAEVREPLVEQEPDSYLVHEKNFKMAQIRVKLHIMEDEMKDAALKKEFVIAAAKEQELKNLEEKLKDLQQNFVVNPKIRKVQNDLKTTYYCLDIVISLMQNTEIQTLPLSVTHFKQEFVETRSEMTNTERFYRILKFYSLYALSDKQFAIEKIKMICSPIIAYRLIHQYDKATLLLSIDAFSDLLRVHGPNILNSDNSIETNSKHASGRRLYDHTQSDISDEIHLENVTCGMVVDIMLDIMNDEMQDLREGATIAVCRLVESGLVVSSTLITRLLLKLFSPLTEKQDQKILQMVTFSILRYAHVIKGSANILRNAILPTLCSIGNAPKTSPLSDVNISSVQRFLAALTKIERNEFSDIHKHLTYLIFENILKKPEDKCACILSMMLQYLDEPVDDQSVITELRKFIENSLKAVKDKQVTKYLSKYSRKLAGYSVSTCTGVSLGTTRASSRINESNPVERYSIHSCRATKGSVNSNRNTENCTHSTTASDSLQTSKQNNTANNKTSVQKIRSRKKDRNDSADSLSESNASDLCFNNLELAVTGVNRQSLRCLNATISDSFPKKTQKKRKKTELNRDKTSMGESNSESDSRKERWQRKKRTNILQLAEKESLPNTSQTVKSVDETPHRLRGMDSGQKALSDRTSRNESTASNTDSPKSQRPSRSAKQNTENMSINSGTRSSMRIKQAIVNRFCNNNGISATNPPRISTCFTPKSINGTKKNQFDRNIKDSLRKLSRKNYRPLNLRNNSAEMINNLEAKRTLRSHSNTLNSAENCRIRSKRTAKSDTSDSDCSSTSLRKIATKKQKIYKK